MLELFGTESLCMILDAPMDMLPDAACEDVSNLEGQQSQLARGGGQQGAKRALLL
jgi:hypothetical protein